MARTLATAALRWGTAGLYEGDHEQLAPANQPQIQPHPTAPAIALLPEEIPDSPDLESIWASYVSGDATLLDLSREHGVAYAGLVKMAAKEGWLGQRRALLVARSMRRAA